MKNLRLVAVLTVALVIVMSQGNRTYAEPLGTAFTYNGMLFEEDEPADGKYDFSFGLFDTNENGIPLVNDVNVADVNVFNGYFTVQLDFGGDVFNGEARWLEIGVRPGEQNDPNEYTTLSPRREITATPYSLYSLRTRGLLVNDNNTFVGLGTGEATTGNYNTFLGSPAGASNTTGGYNTFSGYEAGYWNTTGYENTFSGAQAGFLNTTGIYNTFTGGGAGYHNTTGSWNTFSGGAAGFSNTTGGNNTFLGGEAGYYNTTGGDNTFSGYQAGYSNNTGHFNTFSGSAAGFSNTTGNNNVFLGYRAGYNETGSNKLYIANSEANPPLIYGDFSTGYVGLGTTSPVCILDIHQSEFMPTIRLKNTDTTNGHVGIVLTRTNSTAENSVSFRQELPAQDEEYLWKIGMDNGPAGTESDFIIKQTNNEPAEFTIKTSGNVGIGTTSPAAKLDVNGKIKITDGTQGAGKVLTSDAGGLASWQSLAFGSRISGQNNTAYLAETDGFVVGNTSGLDDHEGCMILSDSSNPPSSIITFIYSAGSITGGNQYPFCVPIKKGDYWMVVDGGSLGFPRISWIPVGE